MKDTIKVLYKAPNEALTEMDVANDLETFQGLVKGYIEVVPLSDEVLMVVNEEGAINGMDFNFLCPSADSIIYGPAVFVGEDGEDFGDCPVDKSGLWLLVAKGLNIGR